MADDKKKYDAPELTEFGSIEKITQGRILGTSDVPTGTGGEINSGVIDDITE